ncbi:MULTISPECIES: 4'-phosphopantetheinyl transferase superfamily protein [unclassified Streptomyces]|nr:MULTISPECIES: 4'-phosphopantetheinyl transferase superfamily protein [unclassified Streptomyces]
MAAAQVPLTRLACSALPCPGCGGPHGRPAVAGPPGEELHFSLSHSGGPALLAFAARPVGVDIERVPGGRDGPDAAASLHTLEQAELAALPPVYRPAASARCWTRKEACLKATGAGISEASPRTLRPGTGPLPARSLAWALMDLRSRRAMRRPARCARRLRRGTAGPPGRRPVRCASTGSRGRR